LVVKSEVFLKWLRRLRLFSSEFPVEDELRGWSWWRFPVRPRAYLGLSVYDVASYCPTRRDVWLRRVLRVRPPPSPQMRVGLDAHAIINGVINVVKRGFYLNLPYEVLYYNVGRFIKEFVRGLDNDDVKRFAYSLAWTTYYVLMSEYLWSKQGGSLQPVLTLIDNEVKVDGTPIGLSNNLRVDALLTNNAVVDFKVGKRYENHEMMLTAYALALEANVEVPIDYGFLVYLNWNGGLQVDVKGVYIGAEQRREFIDARDEVIEMLINEEEPPKAVECIQSCPYINICETLKQKPKGGGLSEIPPH